MTSYKYDRREKWAWKVLILVVMEDGLVPAQIEDLLMGAKVLILVVMEDGLVQLSKINRWEKSQS